MKPIKLTKEEIKKYRSLISTYGTKKKWYVSKFYPETKGTFCYHWLGVRLGGYGIFRVGEESMRAARIAYVLHTGKQLKGMACHKCDNTRCQNPIHIFDGTAKQNTRDMIAKGRNEFFGTGNPTPGEKHWKAVLTEKDVRYIHKHYRKGVNQSNRGNSIRLAKKFGVSYSTIKDIVRGRSWKHLYLGNTFVRGSDAVM